MKHTKGPWEVTTVKRITIGQVVAALANQDEAIVVNGPKNSDGSASIIAIFPTETRKPTKEDYGNALIVSEGGSFMMKMEAIVESHPAEWEAFLKSVSEATKD